MSCSHETYFPTQRPEAQAYPTASVPVWLPKMDVLLSMPEELAVASVLILKRCYQSSCVQSLFDLRRDYWSHVSSFVFDSPVYKAGNDHFDTCKKTSSIGARVGFVFSRKMRLATSRNMLRRMCAKNSDFGKIPCQRWTSLYWHVDFKVNGLKAASAQVCWTSDWIQSQYGKSIAAKTIHPQWPNSGRFFL